MSIRKYEIEVSSSIEEFRRRLGEACVQGTRLEVDASPVADDLSARRGATKTRAFALVIVSIDRIMDDLQATTQDAETSEWATLTVTDTTATLTVVS